MAKKIPKKVVRKLIDRWRERLRVKNTRIYSRYIKKPPGNCLGKVEQFEHGNIYTITVAHISDFKELRDVIIHELLHIVLYPAAPDPINILFEAKVLPNKVRKLHSKWCERDMELVVWRLVDIVSNIEEWKDDDLKPKKETSS